MNNEQNRPNAKYELSNPDNALKAGELQKSRYESYVRLYEQALNYKEWEH